MSTDAHAHTSTQAATAATTTPVSQRAVIPDARHEVGETVHGFTITDVTPIEDIKALVYEARHEATGAELVHVHCHDEENLFSVGFRTPPPDSTGVAHILEHSVLAGSEKYPVKDAFNELGKRTLNTFLNAMTWPDRTVYPTASAVRADYFNLASVYLDLVFSPLLEEKTFKQEGHHLELEDLDDPSSPLRVSGVVYNEMKGANSSPERLHYRAMMSGLFEDTPYAHDSGGDPDAIPDLTYENFTEFHRRFYSPSNARFFLYGDVPLADNLAFVDERLADLDRVDVDSELPLQSRWDAPRRLELEYGVGADDDTDEKSFVTVSWLTNETTDVRESLLMEVAVDALYGSDGSPLRKALVDSGYGQAVYPSGAYSSSGRQTTCTFGLRGTDVEHRDAIEALILETIEHVVDNGLDSELIEASFHQVEFAGKEISPPFPVMLLVRANPVWYFGGDPKDGLRFATMVEDARQAYADDPRVFEKLLQRWLLDNPHRLTIALRPVAGLDAERETARREALAKRKAEMSDEAIERVRAEAAELERLQMEPDTAEALATLPKLTADDIPKTPRNVPTVVFDEDDEATPTRLEHRDFSNGVGYVGLSFDMRDLDDEASLLVPLLGKATRGLGAGGRNYAEMATRMARYTGGIGIGPTVGENLQTGERFEQLTVNGSVLTRNAEVLFDILGDLLLASDTSDHKRLRDLLLEGFSRKRSSVVPSGHAYARTRAAAVIGPHHYRTEQWSGFTQLHWLEKQVADPEASAARLADRIAELQQRIFTRDRVLVSLAGDPEIVDALRPLAEKFVARLPRGEGVAPVPVTVPETMPRAVGLTVPATVNYVAQVAPGPHILDPAAPALALLAKVLKNEFLYKKLRVPLISYRDPNLAETFDVYQRALDWVDSDAFTDELVDGSRVGAIGGFDHVLTAAQEIGLGRRRYLLGLTDEARKVFRDGLFTTTADDIRRLTRPTLEALVASDAPRAVCGSQEALVAANEVLGSELDIERGI